MVGYSQNKGRRMKGAAEFRPAFWGMVLTCPSAFVKQKVNIIMNIKFTYSTRHKSRRVFTQTP
jgi:hypothetical protein